MGGRREIMKRFQCCHKLAQLLCGVDFCCLRGFSCECARAYGSFLVGLWVFSKQMRSMSSLHLLGQAEI